MNFEPEPAPEKSELLHLKQRAVRNNRATLVVGMLLVAYVCILIITNYRSEMATRQTMLEYLKNETDRSADNLSYFFSERQDDLANLALTREVAVFFESKALGMSMEYGLNLSLPPIKERFLDLIQRKRISGEAVYARIALIDSHGTLLVDTASPAYSLVTGTGWKRFLAPEPRTGAVMVVEDGKALLVSMPYRFKGVHEGQILAWLSPGTIPRRLTPEISKAHRTCLVTRDGKDCLLTDTTHLPHDYLSVPAGTPREFTVSGAGGTRERVIVLNVPVKNTPFLLFSIVPAADVLGRVAPWQFFVGMGVLAVAVLGGAFFVVRLNMTHLVLQTRLDETMRRKQEISEQNRRLQDIIEFLPDATFVVDRDRKVVAWNRALEEISGVKKEEIIGKGDYAYAVPFYGEPRPILVDLIFEGDSALARGNYEYLEKVGSTLTLSAEIFVPRVHGGTGAFMSGLAAPLFDGSGAIIGAIESIRDISQRKRAEEELRKYREHLEALVQERTAELKKANDDLLQEIGERKLAEEQVHKLNLELEQRVLERTAELEESYREMEAFCYTVSHDLRAPLRGINGFSAILHDEYADRLDDAGQNYLERISSAAERMGHLIDGLLELSRVTRSELRRKEVDLSGLVRGITEDLKHLEPDRCVEWVIAPDVLTQGDPILLKAMLQNLLINAWKFTGREACATIEFNVAKGGGERVYFVRDNGCGFDMAYVGTLFDPFRRLHKADEYEGTGIGLATVQRIINRHGGRVWAEAAPGEGATFYFTLA